MFSFMNGLFYFRGRIPNYANRPNPNDPAYAYAEAHNRYRQKFDALNEGKVSLRTQYVDSNGRRTFGPATYISPEEDNRNFWQNLGKKPVARYTYKAHNRWSQPEFEYLKRKKR